MPEQAARCAVSVEVGVLPTQPEQGFTRQWFISSGDWEAADGEARNNMLTDLAGQAAGYATFLMVQPERFNWVKMEWVWF